MKKRIRATGILLAGLLTLTTVMAGCGANGNAGEGTTSAASSSTNGQDQNALKPVELKMWLAGDSQQDAAKVFEEINKKLKNDINATVNVQYTTWTDITQKYNLMLSSGEEFDLASCFAWTDYTGLANKKVLREITTDELNKYAPDYMKVIQPGYLKDVEVNGKMYMIPSNKMSAQGTVVALRGDLREKYKLEVKTPEDLINYVTTVTKNEKNIIGYSGGIGGSLLSFAEQYGYSYPSTNCANSIVYKQSDKTGKLQKITAVPEYREYVNTIRKLYEAGVINKDVLSSKANTDDAFKAGKAAAMSNALDATQGTVNSVLKEHPEWKPEIVNIYPDYAPDLSLHNEGMVIPASSKNAERAMMFVNLLVANKEYNQLACYGIQGVHYELEGDKYKALAGSKNFGYEANVPWGFQNDALRLRDVSIPDWYYSTYANWGKAALANANPVAKISFDESKVKTEIAAVNSVASTLVSGLSSGGLDPAKNFGEVDKKLAAAGIDKVIAELQTQIDAKLK